MTDLIDIQSQIERLQRQAKEIKAKEFDKTVREIVSKMHAFGITAKDLQNVTKRSGKPESKIGRHTNLKSKKTAGGGKVAAKYRGPNGEEWSGRGLTPKWLSGLVSEGRSKEEFAISG